METSDDITHTTQHLITERERQRGTKKPVIYMVSIVYMYIHDYIYMIHAC